MKKISDFIYHNSDILVTGLILAAVAFVIFWRVGIILDYSAIQAAEKKNQPIIDIDFSGIDLAPEKEESYDSEEKEESSETAVSFDENFRSPKEAEVILVYADDYQSAVRRTAEAYGFGGEDYLAFYNLLWNKGIELGLDEVPLSPGTYLIPAGSSLEEILRILTNAGSE